MRKKLKLSVALTGLLILCMACKKNTITPETNTDPIITTPNNPPKDTTTTIPSIPTNKTIINVGTGSGNLIIDAQSLNIPGNAIVKIKGGSYNDIKISNFIYEKNNVVTIENDGIVELIGEKQITFTNIKNAIFSGNGTPGITRGFVFRNKSSDAASIQLDGNIDNFTVTNVSFKDLNTYNVIQYDSKKVYDGSDASYSKNLKFLNIDCDNTGTLIRFKGSTENGTITGLISNIELAYITFRNSPNVGSVVSIENVDSYDIHNNLVQNVNQNNTNHNGVFYLQGNGKFYNNVIRDHQGNAVRAWSYSIGTTPKSVLIFNNIVVNSKQYGAFELQSFERNIIPGKTTFVHAQVFNNTCGSMYPKSTFPAQILDLYSLMGGTCDIFNNVGYNFQLVGQNNTNFIWNELSDTKPSSFNNKYFKTYQEAGIADENSFKLNANSVLKGAGIPLSSKVLNISNLSEIVSLDIYGSRRSTSAPSIGAAE
ncbi:hypothetical protein D3C87_590460 [compost metagenome]